MTQLEQARKIFGAKLTELRTRKRLTYRDLEQKTGTVFSSIAAMAAGKRPVDENTAKRLAGALGLTGNESADFLNLALATRQMDRLSSACKEYDPAVFSYVAQALTQMNIRPQDLASCRIIESPLKASSAQQRQKRHEQVLKNLVESANDPVLELELRDGQRRHCGIYLI